MIFCPYCGKHGVVEEVYVYALDKTFFRCNECSRYWENKEDIGVNDDPYRDFTETLLNNGLSGTPDDVKIVSKDI